jgi:GTP cyclohydrolase I
MGGSKGEVVLDQISMAIDIILNAMGENDSEQDENFENTPNRVAKWLMEYTVKPGEELVDILQPRFPEEHHELVIVKDVGFTSLCAHHMLPFRGTAAVGYIPRGTVVGLSKLARAVTFFAQRLTLQERITKQLADGLMTCLEPLGVMVVLQAEHQCMTIRGVKDPNASTITSAVRGVFKENPEGQREEFLRLIGR